jgi:sugar transferase (PEP-CTERM/EpsH1 system associated)
VNLIRHSDPDRFRHDVCCTTVTGPLAARLPQGRSEVFELHKRPGHDWGVFPRLRRLLRARRPHIVHTRNWSTVDLVAAARWAAVPAVVHGEHGWDAGDVRGTRWKANLLRRALAPLTDRWVAVSEDIHRWLAAEVRIPDWKIVTIRNGVDTDRFRPRDGSRPARAPGDPEPLVLGTVGRLDPVKAQRDLLAALARLAPRHPGLRLELVGDGPLRDALAAEARERGIADRVRFRGEVARPEDAYAAFDVFALPSLNEGISNTILEAMASGLPVVATRVGGNPELVVEGATGTLVSPEDPAELAGAIERYLDDPALRRAHATAGRERAERDFSIRTMVRRYEDLYASLFDRRVLGIREERGSATAPGAGGP